MAFRFINWTDPSYIDIDLHCVFWLLSDLSMIIDWLCLSLTHSVTFSKLYRCDPGVWRCQLKTGWGCCCCLLMMRMVLATVCCRFGSWGLFIKLNFCSDFEHNVWSRFYFKVEVQAKFEAGVWSVFCCWCFVEVMKLNLGHDSGQDFEF